MAAEEPSTTSSATGDRHNAVSHFVQNLLYINKVHPYLLLQRMQNFQPDDIGWFPIPLQDAKDNDGIKDNDAIKAAAEKLFGEQDVRKDDATNRLLLRYDPHFEEIKAIVEEKASISAGPVATSQMTVDRQAPGNSSEQLLFAVVDALGIPPDIKTLETVLKKDEEQWRIEIKPPYKEALLAAMASYGKQNNVKVPSPQPPGNVVILGHGIAHSIGLAIKNGDSDKIFKDYKRPPRPLDALKQLLENRQLYLDTDNKANGATMVPHFPEPWIEKQKDDNGIEREVTVHPSKPDSYTIEQIEEEKGPYDKFLKLDMDKVLQFIQLVQCRPYNKGPLDALLQSDELKHVQGCLQIELKDLRDRLKKVPEYAKGNFNTAGQRWLEDTVKALDEVSIKKDAAEYVKQHPAPSVTVGPK